MNRNATERGVIVPMTRLPENIGRMLNMYLAGELDAMHIVACTKDGRILNTSAGNMPNVILKHDSFK